MQYGTVAAISTAYGKGGVAVIRISGDESLKIAQRVFKTKSKIEPRKCVFGEIIRDGDIIDTGLLVYFKGPNSYTGEDVCEIYCHGGIYVTRAVLECVLSVGAKMAQAGEFTKRAYLNGKLTLSSAEAVGKVIDASTDAQLRLSSTQARGVLSSRLNEIREKIISLITRAYATIDYPDEDIIDTDRAEMKKILGEVIDGLSLLKRTYRAGRAVSEGIKTAIVGKPNAGKSSLYNMLVGESVAIVTDIAGTTRDIIENAVSLGGVTLRLADTAGIRSTDDTVEKIGVERARERLESSELILCVFDLSCPESDEDRDILSSVTGKNVIAVMNKTDTPKGISSEFEAEIKKIAQRTVYVSARDEMGYEELSLALEEMYGLGEINISSDAVISDARQHSAVVSALGAVCEARDALVLGQTPDIVCFSLERALGEIDMIDGRETGEEIVNEIFSRFCVGK